MGNLRLEFKVANYATISNGLFEGDIPYAAIASRYSYCTATWVNDAQMFFDGTPLSDAILSYQNSLTDDGEVVMLFPRGVYADIVYEFDGGGTASGNGQPPIGVKAKAWGAPEINLDDFTGALNGQEVSNPLPQRIEIESLKLVSTFLRGTFPTQLRIKGAFPDFSTLIPLPIPEPQECTSSLGMCVNWYDFNFEELSDLLLWKAFRGYNEVQNIKRPEGYRFGPSYNVNQDEYMKMFFDAGKPYFPCFNENFWDVRDGFINAGKTNSDWTNSYTAYGADLEDPESYREMAEFFFQLFFREGFTPGDLADSLCTPTPRYNGDVVQELKTGLGRLRHASAFNESYKTWMEKLQHMTAKAAAVAWFAINYAIGLSGDTSKLGVKNADPNGECYIGQAFSTPPWLALNTFIEIGNIGGKNSDGTNVYQPAFFELHDYLREDVTCYGLPFELSAMPKQLRDLADVIQRYSPTTKLIMGEWGYTTSEYATGFNPWTGTNTQGFSFLFAANGYTAEERHASITLMLGFFLPLYGVSYGCLYQATNQVSPPVPGTNWDKLAGQLHTLFHQWAKLYIPLFEGYKTTSFNNYEMDVTKAFILTNTVPGDATKDTLILLYASGAAQIDVPVDMPNGGDLLEFDPAGGPAFLTTSFASGTYTFSAREYPKIIRLY